jgi:glycosyltransferase involved in cell wall biosynthesis
MHSVTFVAAGYRGAESHQFVDGMTVVRLGGIHSLWLRTFIYYTTRERHEFDVVITEGFGGSRIPRMAPLYVREPIITEWHQIHRELFNAQYPRAMRGPLNALERITAWVHRNTWVRAGTPEWQAAFPSIGFKPENVFVVPVSIREEWLTAAEGSQTRPPNILWLGKFRRYKCPHHVVLALRDVVNRVPEARLTLAGRHDDENYERSLVQLARQLGLEDKIEFRFNVSEREKLEILKLCRVLVVPSSVEGFGIVVLEANACNVPVVASSGVPPSVVQQGLNGLRYTTGDINALSSCISSLLLDDDLHSRLSANAGAFAAQFGWSSIGQAYERAVSSLAAGSRQPPHD